jgi:hypothetical protein
MPTKPAYHRPRNQPARREERQSSHARGYDRAWQRLRDAFLIENPFCFACDAFAVLVDHKTPIVVDPSRRLDPLNLRSCCTDCHAAITANFRMTGVNEMPPPRPAKRAKPVGGQNVSGRQPEDRTAESVFFGQVLDPRGSRSPADLPEHRKQLNRSPETNATETP